MFSAALAESLSGLSVSTDTGVTAAASQLLGAAELLVDDWLSAEREEAEGRGARRDELRSIVNEWVDELVAVAVMEAKQRAPLSRHDRDQADILLNRTPPGSIVASAFNIDIRGKELSCLRRRQWLNDEVINMYLQLVQQRQNTTQSPHSTTQHKRNAQQPRCPRSVVVNALIGCGQCVFGCCDSASGGVSYLRCYYFNTSQAFHPSAHSAVSDTCNRAPAVPSPDR